MSREALGKSFAMLVLVWAVTLAGAVLAHGDAHSGDAEADAPVAAEQAEADHGEAAGHVDIDMHGEDSGHVDAHGDDSGNLAAYVADVSYTLRTEVGPGGMQFVGVGGAIDGVANPTLSAAAGSVVEVTLVNGDGIEHDVAFPAFRAMAGHISSVGESSVVAFRTAEPGTYEYECALPGHRVAGMLGTLVVEPGQH